ncbi:hypothetical protein GCS60_000585 [Vibrio metschnikovii]|nr:hypothetical protein [Vibrio metschnikovii]
MEYKLVLNETDAKYSKMNISHNQPINKGDNLLIDGKKYLVFSVIHNLDGNESTVIADFMG